MGNLIPCADRVTSRRAFLTSMAGGAALALAGCSRLARDEQGVEAPREALGPEPSTFAPPVPEVRRPVGVHGLQRQADVCVVGGGAAGMAAATTAARLGARTVLIEESHVLGGNVTRGLVNLDKVAWGAGPMVAGYFEEIIRRLEAEGNAVFPCKKTHFSVPAELDALRHLVLETCLEAGVIVRLGAKAAWVETDEREPRRIKSVWVLEGGHLVEVQSAVFLDCTGDGHLGYQAGNAYWLGDRTHGQIQGQTLIFYASPVDFDALIEHVRPERGSVAYEYQVIGLRPFMKRFQETHEVPGHPQRGALINRNMKNGKVSISVSEVYGDHLQPGALPAIMQTLQEQNQQIHAAFRKEVPGFERSRILRMAERPYLREGRRLVGGYQLTAADVTEGRKPSDSIARGWYPMDLHVLYAGQPVQWAAAPGGDWYGIPYRCLVARDLDNLLMAGRCISVTHEALGSTRISPVSMALGEAAGAAGALAAAEGIRPADLPPSKVQKRLEGTGCLI